MIRDAGRRLFGALESSLVPAASRFPADAATAAGRIGRLRRLLSRRWPTTAEVRDLFPGLSVRAAARVASAVADLEARNRLLVACVRRAGPAPIRSLVRSGEGLAALRPPLLLATFHAGAWNALGPALERLDRPVLVLRESLLYAPAPPVEVAVTGGDEQRRAAAFQRALVALERGAFVVAALDMPAAPGVRTRCLGHSLELARGPLALARLSGAAMVPVVARWRRRGIDVTAGPVIARASALRSDSGRERGQAADPAGWEAGLAAGVAEWLEAYLLASPEELGLGLLRELLKSPAAGR